MRKLLLLFFLLCASTASAQSPVTVTGLVTDAGNNPATSGTVTFNLIPTASSIHYFVSGVGTITQQVVCGINASGQIKSFSNLANPCTVWGNDVINPANTQYKVTLAPNGAISNIVSGECITGTSYSLNNPIFCPIVQINPQQAIVRSNPFQTNILPIASSTFNVGSPQLPYAAGYFNNLFLNGSQFSTTNLAFLNTNNTFTGKNTMSFLNKVCTVDGVQFTTVAGCLAALPSDIISDTGNSYVHGTIYLPFLSGGYNVSAGITLSPFVKIVGEGLEPVAINCIGSITCITVSDTPFTIRDSDGGLYNLTVHGDGSNNQIGVQGIDAYGLSLRDVRFYGFTGTGAIATNLTNDASGFTERTNFYHVWWFKNTVNIQLNGVPSEVSFGHQSWVDLRFHIGLGAAATGPVFNLTNNADLYGSLITGVVNNDATGGTGQVFVLGASTDVVAQTNFLNLLVDNFGGGNVVGATCTAGSSFDPAGSFNGFTSNSCASATAYYSAIPSIGGSLGGGIISNPAIVGIGSYPSPNNQICTTNGLGPAGIGICAMPNLGTASNFYSGFLWNGWNDGTNFHTQGDGTHNGGAFLLNQTGGANVPLRYYVIPDTGGSAQNISPGTLDSTYFKGNVTSSIGLSPLWGPGVLQCVTNQKSETGADATVLSCTPASVAGHYRATFSMSLSAANAATLGWTITYTDSNGNAQTPTNLALFQQGIAAPALTFTTSAAGNYDGRLDFDVNNAGAPITIKLTFAGTSFAGKVSAAIERLI
jgi:hypothetical protein